MQKRSFAEIDLDIHHCSRHARAVSDVALSDPVWRMLNAEYMHSVAARLEETSRRLGAVTADLRAASFDTLCGDVLAIIVRYLPRRSLRALLQVSSAIREQLLALVPIRLMLTWTSNARPTSTALRFIRELYATPDGLDRLSKHCTINDFSSLTTVKYSDYCGLLREDHSASAAPLGSPISLHVYNCTSVVDLALLQSRLGRPVHHLVVEKAIVRPNYVRVQTIVAHNPRLVDLMGYCLAASQSVAVVGEIREFDVPTADFGTSRCPVLLFAPKNAPQIELFTPNLLCLFSTIVAEPSLNVEPRAVTLVDQDSFVSREW